MNFHALSEIFPLIEGEDLESLALDIEKNGLQNPIVLYEGKILDGRNRFKACNLKNIPPEYEEYEGEDALGYVISLNLHRRHLTESQRSMVAANVANMKRGGDTRSDHSANLREGKISQKQAAELLNVSEQAIGGASTEWFTGAMIHLKN